MIEKTGTALTRCPSLKDLWSQVQLVFMDRQQDENDNAGQPIFKRRRVALACTSCRKRKNRVSSSPVRCFVRLSYCSAMAPDRPATFAFNSALCAGMSFRTMMEALPLQLNLLLRMMSVSRGWNRPSVYSQSNKSKLAWRNLRQTKGQLSILTTMDRQKKRLHSPWMVWLP